MKRREELLLKSRQTRESLLDPFDALFKTKKKEMDGLTKRIDVILTPPPPNGNLQLRF